MTLSEMDTLWLLICAAQVMLMQGGFCLLESGLSRAKNSINVAAKNLIDFCIASIVFALVGFGLMFGSSAGGIVGTSYWSTHDSPSLHAFFLFQLVFCGTATTIISGAVAERLRFRAYLLISVLISGLIYPIFGHWAWGGAIAGTGSGWLASLGFIDFAGSTVVHSVGAWIALSAILVVGPRRGRFGRRASSFHGHNLLLSVFGVLLLWFGWFGFNGGSALAFTDAVPAILVNTSLAASAGGLAGLMYSKAVIGRPDVIAIGNGVLAGLVAITASCHLTNPTSSIVIGTIAAVLACLTQQALERFRIDDVIGAVPVHGVAGVWGTLAVALFSSPDQWPSGNDRGTQLAIQFVGVTVAFAWSFGISFLALYGLSRVMSIRVSGRDERLGLNITEHNAGSEFIDLLDAMHRHRRNGRFDHRLHVEPFTEVGQLALSYNRVIDRVRTEINARQNAELQFRSIYENSLEGIYQSTPDGTFIAGNPALVRTLGFDSFDQLRTSITDIAAQVYCNPSRRADFMSHIERHGEVRQFRSEIRRHNGDRIWIAETGRAVHDGNGNLMYYEGSVVDITNEMTTERLQREIERAEASDAAKDAFLATMSHEMRTPLGGIVSILDMLAEDLTAPQHLRYLRIARQSANTLLALVNDLLDRSKISAGKMVLEEAAFDPTQIIDESIEMLYPRAIVKNVRLLSNISPDVPTTILGDRLRLQQIIVNLLGNAIKFTYEGCVEVRACVVKMDTNTVRLRFEVEDSGIGIPEDKLSAIFDAFEQADLSTTRRFGGTGLGLSICRDLCHLMQGDIGVSSTIGEGSTFWFEIVGRSVSRAANSTSTSPLTGSHLLAVGPTNCEFSRIAKLLREWGAMVTVAETPHAAEYEMEQASAPVRGIVGEVNALTSNWWRTLAERTPGCAIIKIGQAAIASTEPLDLIYPVRGSELMDALSSSMILQQPTVLESTPARPQAQQRRQGPVLVVDDNEVNRIVVAELIRRLGIEPLCVPSASDAIELLRTTRCGAVLMDCEMPETDGIEATLRILDLQQRGLLAEPPGNAIPIIALTAQAIDTQRAKCMAAGMCEFLTKPIERDHFAHILLKHVAASQPSTIEPSIQISATHPTDAISQEAEEQKVDKTQRAAEPVDFDALVRRCGGSRATAIKALRMFRNQGNERIDTLAKLYEAGEYDSLAKSAHAIRGVTSSVSANEAFAVAARIETSIKSGLTEVLHKDIKLLSTHLERCFDWIDSRLESLS